MSGNGCAGGSKRGGTPSSGATRSMILPVVGAGVPAGGREAVGLGQGLRLVDRCVRKTYFGLSAGADRP